MVDGKIRSYVDKFIDRLEIKDYVGIIVYGSYVGMRNNLLSDLDVIVIKDNYDTQDCGSIVIDGVRVEFFIQDLKRLYKLIKNEIDNNDPSHLTKFATCEILYDTDDKIREFIGYAKELYNTKIESAFNDYDKHTIFSINNRIEDLETLINEDSFYALYYFLLEKIRILYGRINGVIELPLMKIERLYNDREYAKKYIASDIHRLPEQEFIELYLKCIKIDNDRVKMFNNLLELYNYSFKNLDFNPTNFHLKFTKKSPFKV